MRPAAVGGLLRHAHHVLSKESLNRSLPIISTTVIRSYTRQAQDHPSRRSGEIHTMTDNEGGREIRKAIVRRFYDDLWNKFDITVADTLVSPRATFRGTL